MDSERDDRDINSPSEIPKTQWGPRSQFRIFALGEHFDVEAYLDTASAILHFDLTIWHIDPPVLLNSGIEVSLGGDRLTIKEQERIACIFLEENRRELIDLARFPGVEGFTLGLYERIEAGQGSSFLITPDTRLMSLASKIGVRPSYYFSPVPISSSPPDW